ncbi:MAG: hypothetical protein ACFFDY_00245 [Candidatus Thorarchaeota archaeon]
MDNKDIVVLDESKRNRKSLKPIELKFLEEYIKNGGNAIQAYGIVKGLDLRDQKEYLRAGVKAAQMMKKIKPTIDEELEAQGLTLKKIAELIFEGLAAYKFDKSGIQLPDFNARHNYLETLCKLRNLFPKPGIDINVTKQNNVLIVPGIMADEDNWLKKLDQVREITDEMRSIDV